MTIDLQALVTAQESDELAALAAAKDAQIAALQAQVNANAKELSQLNAAIDHVGILHPDNAGQPFDWLSGTADKNITLDLTGFTETFRDDFDVDSIMDNNGSPAGGKWYSPVRATFGSGAFARSQVTVANSECRIRIERISPPSPTSDWGSWRTGHIQTKKADNTGFSQPYVPGGVRYFEARMKFPVQDVPYGWEAKTGNPLSPQSPADTHGRRASWPSFWLLSDPIDSVTDPTNRHPIEMDIMECYGSDQNLHSTCHLKPRKVIQPREPTVRQTNGQLSNLNWKFWDGAYHTFGAMFDEDFITVFFDGKSVTRYEMNKFFKVPYFLNISHALFPDQMYAASSPFDLYVDYVRVLAKP